MTTQHWPAMLVLFAIFGASPARAERGEGFLRLTVANEAAKVRFPDATYRPGGGSWVYVPRFGAAMSLGLTHWLALEFGANASLGRGVDAENVTLPEFTPGTLTANYLGVMLPFALTLHYTQGTSWSADLTVSGGPAFNRWQTYRLRDRSDGYLEPLMPEARWFAEWFGRAAAAVEWRPAGWGALSIGPYVGMSTAPDYHVGVLFQASFIVGVGRPVYSFD